MVFLVRKFVCQTDGLLSASVAGRTVVGMVTSPFGDRICMDDGASNNEP